MEDPVTPVPPSPNRVKSVSRQGGEKHKRVKALKCFTEVHEMITTGWPLTEIAQHVQQLKGESADVTEDALVWALGDYRKDLPPGTLVQKVLPKVFHQAAKELADGLDALAELEKLYKLQMKRVEIDHAVETKIQKLMPNMTAEIRMAKDILESYADMQMDLGLVNRRLGTVDVDASNLTTAAANYGKDSVKQVIENPQSRRKLLGLVERFMVVQEERDKLKAEDAALPETAEGHAQELEVADAAIVEPAEQ